MTVTALYHYPIKGLSAQTLPEVELQPGQGFPFDRLYALTDGEWHFDPEDATPQPKTKFLVLMRFPQLAQLRCRFETSGNRLRIDHQGQTVLDSELNTPAGRSTIEAFFARFMTGEISGRPAVVHKAGHLFTDVSVVSPVLMNSISLINLATLRQLEAHLKCELDPLRFRANIYFEGPPGAEQDWIDQEIAIGTVRAKVNFKTRRCAATNVNPATGERDQTIPAALMRLFGHTNLGVYAEVLTAGMIRPGDSLGPAIPG